MSAYQEERQQQIEDSILSRYSLEMASFHTTGQQVLGKSHEAVVAKMRNFDLKCELLIAGLEEDKENEAHVFTVSNPGVCNYYDKVAFWAIGSGEHSALSQLFAFPYSRWNPPALCVMHVLAAKYVAESAYGVGRKTFLLIMDARSKDVVWLDDKLELDVKKQWQALPRVPASAVDALQKQLDNKLPSKKLAPSSAG